jgi:hypothetical protein
VNHHKSLNKWQCVDPSHEFSVRLQGRKVLIQAMQVLCIFKVRGFDEAQYTALMLKLSAHLRSIDCKDLNWTYCLNRVHS